MPQQVQINALNELWGRYQTNPAIFTTDQVGAIKELRQRWGLSDQPGAVATFADVPSSLDRPFTPEPAVAASTAATVRVPEPTPPAAPRPVSSITTPPAPFLTPRQEARQAVQNITGPDLLAEMRQFVETGEIKSSPVLRDALAAVVPEEADSPQTLQVKKLIRQVATLPVEFFVGFPVDLISDPVGTTIEFAQSINQTINDFLLLQSPTSTREQAKEAEKRIGDNPIGLAMTALIATGAVKGGGKMAFRAEEMIKGNAPQIRPVSADIAKSAATAVLAGEPPATIKPTPKARTLTDIVTVKPRLTRQEAARIQSQKLSSLTVINPKDLSQMPAVQAIQGIIAAKDYPGLFEDVRIARKGRSPVAAERLLESRDKSLKQDYDLLDEGALPAEFYERYGRYKDFDDLVELARDEIQNYADTGKPPNPYSMESVDRHIPEPVEVPESMSMLFSSVGVPNPQILLESVKQISRATTEMIQKSKMPDKVRVGFEQGLELMTEHDRMIRRAEATSNWLEQVVDRIIPDQKRQILMVHAYENKMKGKHWDQLNGLEQSITKWLATEKGKLNAFVDKNKVLERMEEKDVNHIFHHWINPETGQPYQAMYGKFSKGLPQAKQRTVSTYEAGIEQGLTPATANMGKLIGLEWQSVMRSHQSRQMFAGLAKVGSGIEGSIIRRKGAKAGALQMVERWDLLRDQGLTEGYERYHHPQIDKPIVFKGADGKTRILKGPVGIRKELYHHVRAYLENPSYGKFDQLNNAAKSLKLASLFHATQLGFQELANFRVPFKNIPRGLRLAKDWGDPVIRLLYEEGLELGKGYEDVGYRNSFFTGETVAGRFGNQVTKPIQYMRDFIFDIVQPGMKTSFAVDTYVKILPKYLEAGKKKGMTKQQSTQWAARQAVKAADGHFSGEHWKRSLLETNQFMVKLYFSPEARVWWQRLLLSPTWQREHLLVAKRVVQSFTPESMIKKLGMEDLGPIRAEYRQYALGAATIIGAADLWNQMATLQMDGKAKHLWENPEDKGFAVRAWWDEPDYTVIDANGKERTIKGGPAYIRPLKSVFEVAEFADDPIKKFGYKLSPFLTAFAHQFFPSKYQQEYKGWPDMPRRVKDFLLDVGTPMAAERTAMVFQGKREPVAAILPFFGFPTSMVRNKSKRATLNQVNKLILEGDLEEATALMNTWNNKHPGDFIVP